MTGLWSLMVVALLGGCGPGKGGPPGSDTGLLADVCEPSLLATVPTEGWVSDVVVSGDHAYVAHDGVGLQILDVSDPSAPTELALFPVPLHVIRLQLVDTILYATTVDRGVTLFDVSNPAWPVAIGSANYDGQTFGLDVEGGTAAVANMLEGVQLLDVSNPNAPLSLGTLPPPEGGWIRDVVLDGSRLYAAVGDHGLKIADLSDPMQPQWVGGVERPGWAYDLAREGDRLYMADAKLGLRIFDLAAGEPELLATTHNDRFASHSRPVGNRVYQTLRWEGLRVLDVTDPQAVTVTERFEQFDAMASDVVGKRAFVASGGDGVQILELCEPSGKEPGPTIGTVSPAVSACGDGVTDPGEACDDGDRADGDGCTGECTLEPGWTCDTSGRPTLCESPADWEIEVEHNGLSAVLGSGDVYTPPATTQVDVDTVDWTLLTSQGAEAAVMASTTVQTAGCGAPGDGCLGTVSMNGFPLVQGDVGVRTGADPEGLLVPTISWVLPNDEARALDFQTDQVAPEPVYTFTRESVQVLSGLVGDARGEVWDPDELLCRGVNFVWVLDGPFSFSGVVADAVGSGSVAYHLDQVATLGPDGTPGTPDDDPSALLTGAATDVTGLVMLVPDAPCGTGQPTAVSMDFEYDGAAGGNPVSFTPEVGWVPGHVLVQLVDWTEVP